MDGNAEAWIVVGGGVFAVTIIVDLGKEWIKHKLFYGKKKNNGGFCNEHHSVKSTLDKVLTAFEDEKQEEIMTRALTKALKKNGK